MPGSNKTVRVRITASQRVCYDKVVLVSLEEWQIFKAKPPEEAADSLMDWVNPEQDVVKADRIDERDFDAFVVDEKGETVTPVDQYDGGEE